MIHCFCLLLISHLPIKCPCPYNTATASTTGAGTSAPDGVGATTQGAAHDGETARVRAADHAEVAEHQPQGPAGVAGQYISPDYSVWVGGSWLVSWWLITC